MQFTKLGELQAVTRITGPHHHFLGVQFSPCPTTALPVLERVSCDSIEAELEAFDSRNTLYREVVDGVSEANNRLGTHYTVSRIRYCTDDLMIPGVYCQFAQASVEHVAQKKEEDSAGELSSETQLDKRGRVAQKGPTATGDPRPLMNESRRAINVDK